MSVFTWHQLSLANFSYYFSRNRLSQAQGHRLGHPEEGLQFGESEWNYHLENGEPRAFSASQEQSREQADVKQGS